jgi:hypothetical protein
MQSQHRFYHTITLYLNPIAPSSKPISPLATVDSETNISASKRQSKDNELHKSPEPAASTASILGRRRTLVLVAVVVLLRRRSSPSLAGRRVQVLGVDADDVVAVAQLARLGAEPEVADRRQLDVRDLEAARPLVLVLVHQVHGELLVLEVRDLGAGREIGVAHAARGAAGELVRFAVVALVVFGLAVADHGHDVGKDHAGPVVLVGVEEDAEAFELVFHAEHGAFFRAGLCHPDRHAVAEEGARAMDLEFELDFPVRCCEGHAREEPAGFGGVGACQADVLVGADDGATAKVEPSGLEVGVEVGLRKLTRSVWLLDRSGSPSYL